MRNIFLIFILTFLGTNTANSKNLDSALGFMLGGDSNQILFPILVDIKRFEVALKDVMKKCKGVKSDY
tara:strand:+ start:197 stop:400 length:204 start_codon:yes stop_codon:yes gene_type:complete